MTHPQRGKDLVFLEPAAAKGAHCACLLEFGGQYYIHSHGTFAKARHTPGIIQLSVLSVGSGKLQGKEERKWANRTSYGSPLTRASYFSYVGYVSYAAVPGAAAGVDYQALLLLPPPPLLQQALVLLALLLPTLVLALLLFL